MTALCEHPDVARLLVCDPFRSAPLKLLSRRSRNLPPFPASSTAAYHGPLRLRRRDPVSPAALERTYAQYERSVRKAAARHGLDRPAVVTGNPLFAGFGRFEWAGPVTYYAWDDFAAAEPGRRWWPAYRDAYARIRATGRRVVGVTETIVRLIAPAAGHAVIPNGIDPREWTPCAPPPEWFATRPHPRMLYVGSLESRISVEQLEGLARGFPTASITLVGPMLCPGHFDRLQRYPNVEIRSRVSRREISGLIAHADVGLIPHVRSSLTESMSPLKLYEYLAGGLPVASVDLPGIRGVSDRVSLVAPGEDMTAAVHRALAIGRTPEADRLKFLSEHAWARRFDRLLDVALPRDAARAG